MTMSAVCEFPQSMDLCYGRAHGYLGAPDPSAHSPTRAWGWPWAGAGSAETSTGVECGVWGCVEVPPVCDWWVPPSRRQLGKALPGTFNGCWGGAVTDPPHLHRLPAPHPRKLLRPPLRRLVRREGP